MAEVRGGYQLSIMGNIVFSVFHDVDYRPSSLYRIPEVYRKQIEKLSEFGLEVVAEPVQLQVAT